MTRLSVNINKIATLRNARGGNTPDVTQAGIDCQRFGAQGITVHPRPDERHITRKDVYDLKKVVTTEFNIEGYPSEDFLKLLEDICPQQATLVPDPPDVKTSNAGWDTVRQQQFLRDVVARIKSKNIRVSLFIEPDEKMIEHAKATGADRVELYTEDYAKQFKEWKNGRMEECRSPSFQHSNIPTFHSSIVPYLNAAVKANEIGLGINAGHDLNLDNLKYFVKNIPGLLEVSIGHALISDALYYGLENAVQMYLREIVKN